jgi:UDP-GlcNAc:undecaprenyl-phosphate GlcNAc-1-phosphate transferase
MPFNSFNLLAVAASTIFALALTPIVRNLARRIGMVAKPKTDRWHKKPTAMLGGVAIWLSVVISYLAFVPHSPYGWVVIGASTFLFLVGLADDILHTKPYQKLIGQVMGSAFVIYYGLTLPWTSSSSVNMALTIFWLIGITNAINLLDNMDGLATGIAVIGSAFLALSFINTGQPAEALMLITFTGALVGFLVYNSHPASIFMGDSGSMFIGFFIASADLVKVSGPFLIRPSLPSCENFPVALLLAAAAITLRTGLSLLACQSVTRSGCFTLSPVYRVCWLSWFRK